MSALIQVPNASCLRHVVFVNNVKRTGCQGWPMVEHQFIDFFRDTIRTWRLFIFHSERCLFKLFHAVKRVVLEAFCVVVTNLYGLFKV